MDPRTVDLLARVVRGDPAPVPGSPGAPPLAEAAGALRRHRLAGMAVTLHRRAVEATGAGPLEPGLADELRGDHAATALRGVILLEARDRCREALAGVGVPSLVFKGAGLYAAGVYHDTGTRPLGDVDVLVARDDAPRAVEALVARGFRPWRPWHPSLTGWLPAFTLDDGDAPPGIRATVDLHWTSRYHALRTVPAEAPDPLWDGARPDAGVPSPEAHFVLLADHLLKHLRVAPHVLGVADLARLVPALDDPDALARAAARRGSQGSTALVLRALADGFGVGVPDALVRALGDAPVPSGAPRHLEAAILFERDGRPGRLEGLRLRWALGGARPWDDARHVLFPSGAWLAARYAERGGGPLSRRARYLAHVALWLLGLRTSPVSPNQEG